MNRRPPVFFRALLRLLPRELREEFGPEMERVATEKVAAGRGSWVGESADIAGRVAVESYRRVIRVFNALLRGGGEPMGTLIQDIRYAVRMLMKTPVVSAVAALSLALGITATASMFAMADGFLLSAVPWEDGDEVVTVNNVNPQFSTFSGGISPAAYHAVAEAGLFESITAVEQRTTNIAEEGMDPEQVNLAIVTPQFSEVVRARPMVGRGFNAADGAEGADGTVIMTYQFWERRYGGDRSIVGRTVNVAGRPHTVIGVMPESFEMVPANLHIITATNLDDRRDDHARTLFVLGRLPAGGDVIPASEAVGAIQNRVAEADPESYEGWTARAEWFGDTFPGPTDTRLIQILIAVSLFGLAIACANVANLLLGRAEQRQREVSVRTALGAARGRILRQMLTESIVLSLIAGGIGVGLSVFVVDWFGLAMPPELPRSLYPQLSPLVLLASAAVTLGAGVLFGLAPALHAIRGDLRDALTGARGGTAGRRRQRLRNTFVIAEFAVAVALLTGSGLLVKAFDAIAGGDSGFEADGVTTFVVTPLADRYPGLTELAAFQTQFVAALEARPEIESAAAASGLARGRNNFVTQYTVAGEEELPEGTVQAANWMSTSADWPATMGVSLQEGRYFSMEDTEESLPVAVVTRGFADLHFPDGDAVGGRIFVSRDGDGVAAEQGRTVVGVIEDVTLGRIEINALPNPGVFVPLTQSAIRTTALTVKAANDGTGVTRALREALDAVDPTLPIGNLKSMEQHVSEQLAGVRMIGTFVGGIGAIALMLAAMGIYGVMAHSVVQRTREIGIRMAMGAERASVIGMVAKGGMSLATIGIVFGLPMAWLMWKLTESALGDLTGVLSPWGPFTLVTVALGTVATFACLIPAVRAATIRPSRALGSDL